MYINFLRFSNLILAPTFGDSLKLASMSSATCKDNKRKRENIGNAERRLNNLTNVWKYVVFASPHSTFTSIHLNSYQKLSFIG